MTIKLHNKKLTSVFALNGVSENSATYALGWALEKSPVFRDAMIQRLFKMPLDTKNAEISLQKQDKKDGGYTDIEIKVQDCFHVIVEAKLGQKIPGKKQLRRYRQRLDDRCKNQLIVSLSAADRDYAEFRDLPDAIEGASVSHLSWSECAGLAETACQSTTNHDGNLWLGQLIVHLNECIRADRPSVMYVDTGDILSKTTMLSTREFGCYMLLQDTMFQMGGSLPDNDENLARICRVDIDEWRDMLRDKMLPFFEIKNGMWWIEPSLDAQIQRFRRRRVVARENGLKGGRPPKKP